MTKKLVSHTFKSSGIQIAIDQVNPLLVMDLVNAIDEPVPPTIKIENPDGSFRDEPNTVAPEHLAALNRYQGRIMEAMLEAYVEYGVVYRLREEDRAEVGKIRALLKKHSGKDDPRSDLLIFIRLVAIKTPEDMSDFIAVSSGKSAPTDPKSTGGSADSVSDTRAATSSSTPLPEAVSPTP